LPDFPSEAQQEIAGDPQVQPISAVPDSLQDSGSSVVPQDPNATPRGTTATGPGSRGKTPDLPTGETREVLVFLKPGTDPKSAANEWGTEFRYSLKSNGDAHVLRAGDPAAARDLARRLLQDPRVSRVVLNEFTHKVHCDIPQNDPYFQNGNPSGFPGQWHLGNAAPVTNANVSPAWDRGILGTGVVIGIVDVGVEHSHPDLSPNYDAADSWNFGNNTPDPAPNAAYDGTSNEEDHATSVSGVAAARGGNGIGGTGAAPLAHFAGLRVDFPNQTTAMFVDATLYHSSSTDGTAIKIKNHSYGDSVPYVDSSSEAQAVSDSASLGTIHLYAAGNQRGTTAEDSNKTQPQNCPDAIAVAAIGSTGTYSSYSSFGSNVFITAPSNTSGGYGITTTDRLGAFGYNYASGSSADGDPFPDLNYTSIFGGTSSATPLVTGILALGKQIQPALDVRWAKHALVRSADKPNTSDSTLTGGGDSTTAGSAWKTNAAGFSFNQNYGFGLVNANSFLNTVLHWSSISPQTTYSTGTVTLSPALAIPDNSTTGASVTFTVPAGSDTVEDVAVTLNITHSRRGDLEGYLTSPSGTTRRIFIRESTDTSANIQWTFLTNEFWGEPSTGPAPWTVKIEDVKSTKTGSIVSYAATVRMGHPIADVTPPSVVSITATSPNPTNLGSVSYAVTFNKWVTGVDASDFALVPSGSLSGTSIASVTGAGRDWVVTVDTGSGSGTLGLNLVDDDSIQDGASNPLGGAGAGNGNFTGQVYTIDRTPPQVVGVSSTAANGIYGPGSILPITITFTENVVVTGSPTLTLATGGAGTPVAYASGSGTSTLTFTYTVGAGQNSPDLDDVSSSALSANGGTLQDLAGNAAILLLPAPGQPGSLSQAKTLLIDTTPPSAPGMPAASSSPNQGTYTVTWSAASDGAGSGLASYSLQRSSNGGASWTTVSSGSLSTTFSETALAQGVYVYQVQAIDLAGNAGPQSPVSASVVVDRTAPGVPGTPVASVNPNAGTYSVSWPAAVDTGGSGVASYTLQRSSNGGGTWATISSGSSATSFGEVNVAQGDYVYQVRAVDGVGNIGAFSPVSLSVVVDRTAPTVPGTPTISVNPNAGSFTVQWTGSTDTGGSGLSSYSLSRSANGGTTWTVISSGGIATLYSESGLTQGNYLYRVQALDAVGNASAISATSVAVVVDKTAPTAPGGPTTSSANPNHTGTFVLSWTASTDTGGASSLTYTLERSGDGGATWSPLATGLASAGSTDSGLVQGSYLYRVHAIDAVGNVGPLSPVSVAMIVDTTAPGAPGVPSASPNPSNTGSFTVSWSAAVDTGGSSSVSYVLERSLNGGAFVQAAAGIAGTSSLESGLAAGSYRYRVHAVDLAGNIGPLSPISPAVGVNLTPPDTMITLSPPNPSSSTGATFGFRATVANCTFETQLDGGAWTSAGSSGFQGYTGLSNAAHTFQVRAIDTTGNPDPTPASYTWTVNSTGGDTAAPDTILLTFPPNPTSLTTATFTFLSTEPGSTFEVNLDGAGWTGNGATASKSYSALSIGNHLFQVRAKDPAGNTDPTPASYAWSIVHPPVDGVAPLLNPFSTGSSIDHWSLSGTDPTVAWTVDGTVAAMPGGAFHSAPFSLNYNNGIDYDTPGLPNSGTATSPLVDISGNPGARLKFFCNYQTETTGTDHDFRVVQVSNDGFSTFLVNEQLSTTPGSLIAGPCPAMGAWHEHVIPLTGMTGPVSVRFSFDTGDSGLNNFGGWYIDDFEISDLMVSGIQQTDGSGGLPLPVGGTTSVSSLNVAALVSADATGSVTLQVEVQPVGTAFTGVPSGTANASGAGAPITLSIVLPADGPYHWRARTVMGAVTSSWMSFGLNAETDPDLVVQTLPPANTSGGGGGGGGGGGCGSVGLDGLLLVLVAAALSKNLKSQPRPRP
jgi:subtilisin-like proprotein convertase family protein